MQLAWDKDTLVATLSASEYGRLLRITSSVHGRQVQNVAEAWPVQRIGAIMSLVNQYGDETAQEVARTIFTSHDKQAVDRRNGKLPPVRIIVKNSRIINLVTSTLGRPRDRTIDIPAS